MNVELIDYTGAGSEDPARHAANVLVFTKQTRLNMSADLMDEIERWSLAEIANELEYMANTIPSSWEFVDYTFLITNVSRAFTHQFVRTRTGSFAQQTMRVLNKHGWTYETGPTLWEHEKLKLDYDEGMRQIAELYDQLIEDGAKIEDARGILPTNIHTNIVAKFNLRTLCDMFRKRASGRTQGEYREVIDLMKDQVLSVHPWASMFIERDLDRATKLLESGVSKLGIECDVDVTPLLKLIDQLRMMG